MRRFNRVRIFGIAMISLLLIVGVFSVFSNRNVKTVPNSNLSDLARPSLKENPVPAAGPQKTDSAPILNQLRERFGDGIEVDRADDGRVISIRKTQRQKQMSGEVIATETAAIKRAREILRSIEDVLRLRAEAPLEIPMARLGESGISVYFQETYKGLPVAPFGQVSVHMDLKGELFKVESDYVSGLRVENTARLSKEDAKVNALGSLSGMPHLNSDLNDGGESLVWVSRESANQQNPFGQFAYQYSIGGVQVVVDAESGAILYKRNRNRN